ncbi:hypothetical protein COHA_010489 [Chlorella ohadii]|uniref:Snurportin-1 n=1 Tax=Chlorella ohadii TaxID=2649997 RepID=A0AAD5H176_9CHLO|nr:hypothetical protein COHA_010489 [Chlorella ohadii]
MQRSVKQLPGSFQERRRAQALEKQKSARRQATDRARKLALGADDAEDVSQEPQQDAITGQSDATHSPEVHMGGSGGRRSSSGRGRRASSGGSGLRQYYAAQLMQPEWLVDVPPDLGTEWYALPRPEGQRCLVISARGQTVTRLRSGVLYERFASRLPAGGPGQGGDDNFCIMDCVYHAADQTYYILDLMCWKGYSLYGCSAEFRLFWVQSKLAECGATEAHPVTLVSSSSTGGGGSRQQQQSPGEQQPGAEPMQQQHMRRFLPLPAYRCTAGGLQMAHSHPVSFTRDGILLLHKEGQYEPGTSTPLALLWKDAVCSQYFIDTDAAGVPLAQQQVVLEYRMDRTVATADDPPVVLGRMPDAFVQQLGDKLRPGKLLKFAIGPAGISFQDGQPVGADLHFAGPANQRRGRADSASKILFQHAARTQPITLQQLQASLGGI